MKFQTSTDFVQSIYEEHFEEASFLYEQRRFLLDDEYLDWRDLAPFEERLEAHLDGLVLGGDAALAVLDAELSGSDEGGMYAAVRVMCRLQEFDRVRGLMTDADLADAALVEAWADALAQEMPETDPKSWLRRLEPELGNAVAVAVRLAGMRRLEVADDLQRLLGLEDPPEPVPLIRAAGRVWNGQTVQAPPVAELQRLLEHGDGRVSSAAAVALLRMGQSQVVSACRDHPGSAPWSLAVMGICGERSDADVMLKCEGDRSDPGLAEALGWLGNVLAVEPLLAWLESPAMAAAAAFGLELITGAGLTEEVFVAETPDAMELFEDEQDDGQSDRPRQPPPDYVGTAVTRLVRDRQAWQAWWQANRSRFYSDNRYRFGRPVTPQGLLEDLLSGRLARRHRQTAIDELAVRYALDVGFETRMPVARQIALADKAQAALAAGQSWQPGQWYFAGAVADGPAT